MLLSSELLSGAMRGNSHPLFQKRLCQILLHGLLRMSGKQRSEQQQSSWAWTHPQAKKGSLNGTTGKKINGGLGCAFPWETQVLIGREIVAVQST